MVVSELVPKIYYSESRDFAYIGRLFELVINYIKTGADLVAAPLLTENINVLSADLLTTTLGFETNPNYLTRDLVDICTVFSQLLKQKGSLGAIKLMIQTLLSSLEIMSDFAVEYSSKKVGTEIITDYTSIDLYLPPRTVDTMLIEKILDYILPAGVIYHIKPAATLLKPYQNTTTIYGKIAAYKSPNTPSKYGLPDIYTGKVYSAATDVSEGPEPVDTGEYDMSNNKRSFTTFGVVATDDK